jgi:hypothetical protein
MQSFAGFSFHQMTFLFLDHLVICYAVIGINVKFSQLIKTELSISLG